jgi:hypothetical protein
MFLCTKKCYLSNRRFKNGTRSSEGLRLKSSSVSPSRGRPVEPGGRAWFCPCRPMPPLNMWYNQQTVTTASALKGIVPRAPNATNEVYPVVLQFKSKCLGHQSKAVFGLTYMTVKYMATLKMLISET